MFTCVGIIGVSGRRPDSVLHPVVLEIVAATVFRKTKGPVVGDLRLAHSHFKQSFVYV